VAPTYVIGYDASESARAALAFTTALARATGARTIAAHVYPSLVSPDEPHYGRAAVINAHVADAARADAERLLGGVDKEIETRALPGGSAAHVLHDLAERESAELLAVGATHRRALGRLAPGSTAERLLHGSPCPVVVAPARAGGGGVRSIAIAYDGREESVRALGAAEVIALQLRASLLLITGVDPGAAAVYLPPDSDEAVRAMASRARQGLDDAAAALRARGLDVETRLVVGAPARGIVDSCTGVADLLVIGSRGYGPMRAVLVGGVSRQVVDRPPCPVMVMPRGATVGPGATGRRGERGTQVT
jgi:nucleotide-binding universal stress UspA family protein